mmetsp:Transcript_61722/g.200044  ORF Transcript_61722/g.200044 Transcript_61722/m.200044 type:complete len:264 (+) Transcript_61722:945-1736(+)
MSRGHVRSAARSATRTAVESLQQCIERGCLEARHARGLRLRRGLHRGPRSGLPGGRQLGGGRRQPAVPDGWLWAAGGVAQRARGSGLVVDLATSRSAHSAVQLCRTGRTPRLHARASRETRRRLSAALRAPGPQPPRPLVAAGPLRAFRHLQRLPLPGGVVALQGLVRHELRGVPRLRPARHGRPEVMVRGRARQLPERCEGFVWLGALRRRLRARQLRHRVALEAAAGPRRLPAAVLHRALVRMLLVIVGVALLLYGPASEE